MRYATNTTVPIDRSKAEIENTLRRYGAKGFGYMTDENRSAVVFEMSDRRIRFSMTAPEDSVFLKTPAGRTRSWAAARKVGAQARKEQWRALSNSILSKLASIEAGVETFEEAFLSHVVLPNGMTVGESISGQIEESYLTGRMPPLLPAPSREGN